MFSAERSAVSRRARCREAQQHVARFGARAVLGEPLDLDLGIERAEEGLGDGRPATTIGSRQSITR